VQSNWLSTAIVSYLGLAIIIYIYIYSVCKLIFGREINRYTVIFSVYTRFWPTLVMFHVNPYLVEIYSV